MPLDRRTAVTLDTDSPPERVANGRAQALRNVVYREGAQVPVRGLAALPLAALPAGHNVALDGVELPGTGGGVAWLVWNADGNHSVVRQLGPGEPVQVLLTWAGLHLPVPTGAAYVAPVIVETLLGYLDADGEARALPLDRLAAGEFGAARLALEPWCLHVAKVPPRAPLQVARQAVAGNDPLLAAQLVAPKAWQFSYRYQYVDGEVTVLAPFSRWLDVLTDPATSLENAILVRLPVPPAGVRELDLLVRSPGDTGWRVVESLRRDPATELLPTSYTFTGVTRGGVVAGDDATRLFEYLWPGRALAAARNRFGVGGPTGGYITPEVPFTVEVVTGNAGSSQGKLYHLKVELTEPDPNGGLFSNVTYVDYYFAPADGTYPDPTSTYYLVTQTATGFRVNQQVVSYDYAFGQPYYEETNRFIDELPSAQFVTDAQDLTTFHENSTYRVVVQFYDDLGRVAGCSQPRTVSIPAQDYPGVPTFRSLRCRFLTTDPAALNVEIPAWAASCQFLVAPNDRTSYFLAGRAADVLGYLGQTRTINTTTGADTSLENVVDAIHNKHQKVLVDIGNWPATGLGYVFRPGDRIRFLNENLDFPITGQRGDYLEVPWTGYPSKSTDADGRTQARVEIYTPNLTAGGTYYERGPVVPIVRTGSGATEQRSYATTEVLLEGDCYLVPLFFPVPDRSDPNATKGSYVPPNKKVWAPAPAAILVESMVPPFRLAPSSDTTTVVHEETRRGLLDGGLFGLIKQSDEVHTSEAVVSTANTATRTAANLTWLDMRQGGRPGVQIPLALQRVTLEDALSFSGARVAGTLLNGLSTWQAADQREVARELGAVQALAPASDTQSEDQVLVAVCTQGVATIGVGVTRVRQSDGGTFSADTSEVVGFIGAKQGSYGTRHPATVRGRGGHLYWWCQDRGEVCRYAQDGVNGLNGQHECRTLGRTLADTYARARITAAYDTYEDEYVLAFGAVGFGTAARTERYSERAQGFAGSSDYVPELLLGTSTGRLLAVRAGQAWETSATVATGTFFGERARAQVALWANAAPNLTKLFEALAVVAGTARWQLTEARTPAGQVTRLPATGLELLEDAWVGALLCDETTPGFAGPDTPRRARYEGRPMQGLALLLTLECDATDPAARLLEVGVAFSVLGGQSPPA